MRTTSDFFALVSAVSSSSSVPASMASTQASSNSGSSFRQVRSVLRWMPPAFAAATGENPFASFARIRSFIRSTSLGVK